MKRAGRLGLAALMVFIWMTVTTSVQAQEQNAAPESHQKRIYYKTRAEAEAAAAAEEAAESKTKAEEAAESKTKAEEEAEAKEKAEAKAKAEARAKARAEARAKAKADARAKVKAEAKAKAEAETKAETKAREKAEAEKKAEASAREKAEAEKRAKAEAMKKAEAEKKAKAEAEAKAKAEAETKKSAQAGGVNMTGKWKLDVRTTIGAGTPIFDLKQEGNKLTGMYRGSIGNEKVTGEVTGKKFIIRFTSQGVKVTYNGTIDGNNIKGTIALPPFGDGTFKGKR